MATQTREFQQDARPRSGEHQSPDPGAGRRWFLRGTGAALLGAGWIIVSFVGGPIVSAVVFAALATYAYVAAAVSRRTSVDDEKRLRMELLVHNMELEKLASKDDLTQLYNRSYFLERLERELKTAEGFDRPVSVLLIDIDDMKGINAAHGQKVGDAVLKEFGRFLLAQTRASDLPARVDGDCFAVILPDTAGDGADIMIERLKTALPGKAMYDDGRSTIEVSVSLGVAGYPWSSQTLDEILREAELAATADRSARGATFQPAAGETVPAVFRKAIEGEAGE